MPVIVKEKTGALRGLSDEEARAKLRAGGPNELPNAGRRTLFVITLEVFREPLFLLLISCGLIYLSIGEMRDAVILLGFVLLIIGITIFQERRTESALAALRRLSSPRALVIRGGRRERIAGRDVVEGDIVILTDGDRVPADGVLLEAVNLLVDESVLTGESVPVRKSASEEGRIAEKPRPGGDDLPYVYSGTLVVKGEGTCRVTATGMRSEIGRIGGAIRTGKPGRSSLQQETGRIIRRITAAGLVLFAVVVIAYGLTRHDWVTGFLTGLTLAMAILPEEYPVVLTVYLALGAWRISRKNVLTRRMPAVETLGSATVLCVDKTGTLTLNEIHIAALCADGSFFRVGKLAPGAIPEAYHPLLEYSVLASQENPHDPMDKACAELTAMTLAHTEHIHHSWELVREYPLEKHLLAISRVWRSPGGAEYVIAAKGAPEAVIDLCHLGERERGAARGRVDEMARQGLRVLGVAKARFRAQALPRGQHDFPFEFVGLLGMVNPVRPGVERSIRECHDAGVRVVMMTGDYPETALNVAQSIGITATDEYISGADLDAMTETELRRKIRTAEVFARVLPEQKLRIVDAFKKNGEVVAMTGDGVNDAPALRAAHIGIAMGGRGTDVAREAASLVLLDDDFTSIVGAVRSGRRIFDNLKMAVAFILAVHIPIVGISLIPVLLTWPLVLLPVHVAFLQLIIDPTCSIVFEAEPAEPGIMDRPPRALSEPLFDSATLVSVLVRGMSILLVLLAVYWFTIRSGRSGDEARTVTFTALIISNLGLILASRSRSKTVLGTLGTRNRSLWIIIGIALVLLWSVLSVPFLRQLFHFSPIRPQDILVSIAAGIAGVMLFEGYKIATRRRA